jgi:hypothetical protein
MTRRQRAAWISLAIVSVWLAGCGGKPVADAGTGSATDDAPNQAGVHHRRFEVKTRDVFDHSFALERWVSTDKDVAEQASLHPQSALEADCAEGWEPYAIERVTENTAVLKVDQPYAMNRVFVRYYLKREADALAK